MNDKKFEKEINKAIEYSNIVKQKKELKELKHSNDTKKEKLSFGKIGFILCIANITFVEIYSLILMTVFRDMSALPALIAAVFGDCLTLGTYNFKSQKENTAGGIVYETAMWKLEHETNNDSDESVG